MILYEGSSRGIPGHPKMASPRLRPLLYNNGAPLGRAPSDEVLPSGSVGATGVRGGRLARVGHGFGGEHDRPRWEGRSGRGTKTAGGLLSRGRLSGLSLTTAVTSSSVSTVASIASAAAVGRTVDLSATRPIRSASASAALSGPCRAEDPRQDESGQRRDAQPHEERGGVRSTSPEKASDAPPSRAVLPPIHCHSH